MANKTELSDKMYNTPFYRSWYNMKTRCNNPKSTNYIKWGGRGITYDKKWHTFKGFYDDMYSSYVDGMQLDRINNDGNYNKTNCRWATRKQQCNNRSNSKIIYYNNEYRTLTQWVEHLGLKGSTIRQRLYVYKWTPEQALTGKRG